MAELLVRVVDKVNADFYMNLRCTKRGDVIVICPDDWPWGSHELASKDWRIVKLPGVDPADLAHLLAEEVASSPDRTKTLQRRGFKIDLDALPAEVKTALADDRRERHIEVAAKTVTDRIVQKPAVEDPNEIGGDPRVIG